VRAHLLADRREPALDRRLSFRVLAVEPCDHLVRRLPSLEVWVVAIAERELATGGRMRADAPTAGSWQLYLFTS
jgi:hypothetical protein